jgi:protein TonB
VSVTKDEEPIFTQVEEQPQFPQGYPALFKWLSENIKYPDLSRQNKSEGTVYVGFTIEKDGSISNVQIKRGVKEIVRETITIMEANGIKGNKIVEKEVHLLDSEARRVISMMPNWTPGKNNGKPVRVAYTLPIKFKLE